MIFSEMIFLNFIFLNNPNAQKIVSFKKRNKLNNFYAKSFVVGRVYYVLLNYS